MYIITKKVHQFSYYLSSSEFINGKHDYKWTGLKNNAKQFTLQEANNCIDSLNIIFKNTEFKTIQIQNLKLYK